MQCKFCKKWWSGELRFYTLECCIDCKDKEEEQIKINKGKWKSVLFEIKMGIYSLITLTIGTLLIYFFRYFLAYG